MCHLHHKMWFFGHKTWFLGLSGYGADLPSLKMFALLYFDAGPTFLLYLFYVAQHSLEFTLS